MHSLSLAHWHNYKEGGIFGMPFFWIRAIDTFVFASERGIEYLAIKHLIFRQNKKLVQMFGCQCVIQKII